MELLQIKLTSIVRIFGLLRELQGNYISELFQGEFYGIEVFCAGLIRVIFPQVKGPRPTNT